MEKRKILERAGFFPYSGNLLARVSPAGELGEVKILIAAKFDIDQDYCFYESNPKGQYNIARPAYEGIRAMTLGIGPEIGKFFTKGDWPLEFTRNWPGPLTGEGRA